MNKPKDNQKNLRENKKNKAFKGFRPTLGYGFCFFVFWFSRWFLENQTNLRENQKHKNQKKSKGGSETFKSFVVFVFSLVVFGIFGFPEGLFGFLKTFGKTKKELISKGGSETFKHFVCWFSRRFCWCSLVFFCTFGFPEAFSRWSRCLGFRY